MEELFCCSDKKKIPPGFLVPEGAALRINDDRIMLRLRVRHVGLPRVNPRCFQLFYLFLVQESIGIDGRRRHRSCQIRVALIVGADAGKGLLHRLHDKRMNVFPN